MSRRLLETQFAIERHNIYEHEIAMGEVLINDVALYYILVCKMVSIDDQTCIHCQLWRSIEVCIPKRRVGYSEESDRHLELIQSSFLSRAMKSRLESH